MTLWWVVRQMNSEPKTQQELQDSLESLHKRMDSFYSWAAQLQLELRNIQKRQVFLESQAKFDFSAAADVALQERLEKIKKL
jgi:hypothetical protein